MRKQVINFYKKGMKLKEISEATGLCWKAVRNAIDLYEQRGVKGLKPGRRGRPSGKGRKLTEEQEKQVQKDICDKRPEQLKMDFALQGQARPLCRRINVIHCRSNSMSRTAVKDVALFAA